MLQRLFMRVIRFYLSLPKALRWVLWILPILYLMSPVDGVPDPVPVFGRIDDLIVIFFLISAFNRAGFYEHFFKRARQTAGGQGRQQTARSKPNPAPHEVLGVSPNADPATVKSAYRRMLKAYHPDRFAHLGPKYEEEAQQKTREIIQAYQAMCAA